MINEKQEKLTEMLDDFCDEYLNNDYKEISQKIIEEMVNGKSVYFKREKPKILASAVIYAICQINSLFDESNEVHITRKDITNYFNTNQSVVSKKAMNLRNIYNLDGRYSLDNKKKSEFAELEEVMHANIIDYDYGDEYSMSDEIMSLSDYQKIIDNYERKFGKRFFEENEGYFWLIKETRPYMQYLFDQAQLLWALGKKEKAINQYKYMLKLNPNDNQGVRDTLLPNLLELNRLDEAQELYLEYEEDCSASWKFGKLLLDIKNDVPFDEIEMEYKQCIESNPYIVPYLMGRKKLPNKMPYFYGIGDENEAIFYAALAEDAWHSDKKAMKILKKLSKK